MPSPRDPRSDFPILQREINGKPLIYFDNAATTQKPQAVIGRLSDFLAHENANIHRGVHYLSMQATDAFDEARARVANFLNASHDSEIIFTRGTTESINLVARSFAAPLLEPGDEILVSVMEHHANIVPWQLIAEETGAKLTVAPITESGEIDAVAFAALINSKTKLAALIHVSNVLGTVNPVADLVHIAHENDVPILIDGAQAVPHSPADVQNLGCDFYTFSGHKIFGPDGIGVLYGKRDILAKMPPYQGGGDMIEQVSFSGTTFRTPPERFEAGTPNISGAIGLAATIDYLDSIGWDTIHEKEQHLLDYGTTALESVPGLRIHGRAQDKAAVISFSMDSAHPHDVGTILDAAGIAVRAGHHCAQPLMEHLGVAGTTRASFAFYNTTDEIDQLVQALHKVNDLFAI